MGEGQRVKRQLFSSGLDGLGTLNPIIQGDSSDLVLTDSSPFVSLSSTKRPGFLDSPRTAESLQLDVSPSVGDRPLNELSSIEQFATLFQLANSPDESSIVRVLQAAGLVTMLGLLETSGLLQQLVTGEKSPFIIMAPSQKAFSILSQQRLFDLVRGPDLLYHVIPLKGRSVPEFANDSVFRTLQGPKMRFNVYGDMAFANGIPIIRDDLKFTHGTIQVVDSILQPPIGDLRRVLVNSGHSLTRITTLLTVVGSFDEGAYTLLAPLDSAISSKGYSWPDFLMQMGRGKDLVERHMLKGTWYSEGLLQDRTMTTLAGTSITFRRDIDGTLTANGIPMKSCNLSASNGVVHVVADVIPDSDLGTDPTAIPNPLFAPTESPLLRDIASNGEIIPEIPIVSGLYELPGQDPFEDFIPVNPKPQAPTKFQTSDLSLVSSPLFATDFKNPSTHFENIDSNFNLPDISSYHHTGNDDDSQNRNTPGTEFIPNPLKSVSRPLISNLESFLVMLDKTSQYNLDEEFNTEAPQLLSYGSDSSILQTNNKYADNIVNPLPSLDQSLPQIRLKDPLHMDNQSDISRESPINAEILQVAPNFPTGEITELIDTTPGFIAADPFVQSNLDTTKNDAVFHTPQSASRNTGEPFEILLPANVQGGTTPEDIETEIHSSTDATRQNNTFNSPALTSEELVVLMPGGDMKDEDWSQLNIGTLLKRLGLSKFAELIEISGLLRTLNFNGPWTIFAPTNEAVELIPESSLREMIEHPSFLRRIISYHVAPGRFLSGTTFAHGTHLPTLHAGYSLVLSYYNDGLEGRWVAGGSVVSTLDEEASNGVVHVIDRVLYAPYGSVITTISLSPILMIFSKILSEILAVDGGVQAYLSGSNPVTVFAPADDSLRNVTLPEDPLVRREWILSHVVEGTWYTAGFSSERPLATLSNRTLNTDLSDDGVALIRVNDIGIIYPDITSSNGVLHVIESPLLSPT